MSVWGPCLKGVSGSGRESDGKGVAGSKKVKGGRCKRRGNWGTTILKKTEGGYTKSFYEIIKKYGFLRVGDKKNKN